MKTISLFLIDGFEEIEVVATVDVLRRAGLDVKTVSLTGRPVVTGAHGIPVTADVLFDDAPLETAEMLIMPGGTPAYNEHEGVKKAFSAHHDKGGKVAAICAAPAVLGGLGILRGRNATCYPGYEAYIDGATMHPDCAVVVDGNVTTGRGPGLTVEFALSLVEQLAGREVRDKVAAALLVK